MSASGATSAGAVPSAAASVARRSSTALSRSELSGPRFEAPLAVGSYPSFPAAEGRGQNHSFPVNCWPMIAEPNGLPPLTDALLRIWPSARPG